MITPAEVAAAIQGIKTTIDIAKGFNNLKNDNDKNLAISEVINKLIEAQNKMLQMQHTIRELTDQIESNKSWDEERSKYELKEIDDKVYVYMERNDSNHNKPRPYFCTNCFLNKKISILQRSHISLAGTNYECPACKSNICNYKEVDLSNSSTYV